MRGLPLPNPVAASTSLLDLARRGVDAGARAAGWAERGTLRLLRDRLDAVAPPPRALLPESETEPDRDRPLAARMEGLLHASLEQRSDDGMVAIFHQVLDQLVPDEARIIGALSEGGSSPMVDIHSRSRTGGRGRPLLLNSALVGRTANLALPRLTPTYVARLRAMGLVEVRPEDPDAGEDYEILLAETHIREVMAHSGRLAPRIQRRTLALSPLGQALWDHTCGGERDR